jgi:hypothetical protein
MGPASTAHRRQCWFMGRSRLVARKLPFTKGRIGSKSASSSTTLSHGAAFLPYGDSEYRTVRAMQKFTAKRAAIWNTKADRICVLRLSVESRLLLCKIGRHQTASFAAIAAASNPANPPVFLDGETRAPRGLAVTCITCITCIQSERSRPGLRLVAGLFGATALPVIFLLALEPNAKRQVVAVIIAAFVMQPLIVVLHELGQPRRRINPPRHRLHLTHQLLTGWLS